MPRRREHNVNLSSRDVRKIASSLDNIADAIHDYIEYQEERDEKFREQMDEYAPTLIQIICEKLFGMKDVKLPERKNRPKTPETPPTPVNKRDIFNQGCPFPGFKFDPADFMPSARVNLNSFGPTFGPRIVSEKEPIDELIKDELKELQEEAEPPTNPKTPTSTIPVSDGNVGMNNKIDIN